MDIIRQSDIEVIKNNIENILYDSKKYIKNNFDIKLQEYNNIFNIILNYIKDNKKIIYGGFAIDILIKYKNKDDYIYDDDISDIKSKNKNYIDELETLFRLHKQKYISS